MTLDEKHSLAALLTRQWGLKPEHARRLQRQGFVKPVRIVGQWSPWRTRTGYELTSKGAHAAMRFLARMPEPIAPKRRNGSAQKKRPQVTRLTDRYGHDFYQVGGRP